MTRSFPYNDYYAADKIHWYDYDSDFINSPVSLAIGQTIGGHGLNSNDKMEALIDVGHGLITVGLAKTGLVIKTLGKASL